mmetsp:Transcript_1879/g.5694  ORF Transcript_1879/g.5694 Transcript_1879/m.5694 type:complete len:224 (+) Transcript_1879:2052-2723(+)
MSLPAGNPARRLASCSGGRIGTSVSSVRSSKCEPDSGWRRLASFTPSPASSSSLRSATSAEPAEEAWLARLASLATQGALSSTAMGGTVWEVGTAAAMAAASIFGLAGRGLVGSAPVAVDTVEAEEPVEEERFRARWRWEAAYSRKTCGGSIPPRSIARHSIWPKNGCAHRSYVARAPMRLNISIASRPPMRLTQADESRTLIGTGLTRPRRIFSSTSAGLEL